MLVASVNASIELTHGNTARPRTPATFLRVANDIEITTPDPGLQNREVKIHKRCPELSPTSIKTIGIDCRDISNISIKMYLYRNHLVHKKDRFNMNVLPPQNPNVTTKGLVLEPIVAAPKGRELSNLIGVHHRFNNHTNMNVMLSKKLPKITRG